MANLTQYGYFTAEQAEKVADHLKTWYGVEASVSEAYHRPDEPVSHWFVAVMRDNECITTISTQTQFEAFVKITHIIADIDRKAAQA